MSQEDQRERRQRQQAAHRRNMSDSQKELGRMKDKESHMKQRDGLDESTSNWINYGTSTIVPTYKKTSTGECSSRMQLSTRHAVPTCQKTNAGESSSRMQLSTRSAVRVCQRHRVEVQGAETHVSMLQPEGLQVKYRGVNKKSKPMNHGKCLQMRH